MKEYKKPLIEDELVEIDDVIALSGGLTASSETPMPGFGDNVEEFPEG